MTENTPQVKSTRSAPTALFLETSAQILRLQGPHVIQQGIRELIDATRQVSGQIGTSAHVKREFDYVVNGFFDEVKARIALLTDPETDRPIEELWREVRDVQIPMFFLGGRSLLDALGDYITDLYKGRLVRPMFLDNVVSTYREQIIQGFVADNVFDKSSCNVWDPPSGACRSCEAEPSDECELKDTCVLNRANFLAGAATIARARPRLKETEWFNENLERLHALEGKDLQEFLSKQPDQVGDLLIFWEVPEGWTILSRDRAFQLLRDKHREEIEFLMVRMPRKQSGKSCRLRLEGATEQVEGILDNYNSKGARVYAPGLMARTRQLIDVQSEELTPRTGRVTEFHKPASAEEDERNKLRPTIGLKFRALKAKL